MEFSGQAFLKTGFQKWLDRNEEELKLLLYNSVINDVT